MADDRSSPWVVTEPVRPTVFWSPILTVPPSPPTAELEAPVCGLKVAPTPTVTSLPPVPPPPPTDCAIKPLVL